MDTSVISRSRAAGDARPERTRNAPKTSTLRPAWRPSGDSRPALKVPGLILLAVVGCTSRAVPVDIVPGPAKARRALDLAMRAWTEGRPTGTIEPTTPRVQVVDAHRKPGQALRGYEVLAESPSAHARTFSLRLDLANPEEKIIVRFLVVGNDPVLVFRQEDYDLIMHWEHKMEPEQARDGDASIPGER